MHYLWLLCLALLLGSGKTGTLIQAEESSPRTSNSWINGNFSWTAGAPILTAGQSGEVNWISVKDPSIVHENGSWHLFCTVRGRQPTHAIVYVNFRDWKEAADAPQQRLNCHSGYFCAPQVFYFAPHQRWYLICQASDKTWSPEYQPAFCTTTNLSQPGSWTRLKPFFDPDTAPGVKAWLDFWVICDEAKAHLFYTSLDGKMWRCETLLSEFPGGWSKPVLALQGDIFEASHTYYLRDQNQYLTLIEAQNGRGWRYYKAYLADRLDGTWKSLAADKDHAFASMENVDQPHGRWTDVVSHGELLRGSNDQRLEVNSSNLKFLIQGVLDKDRQGKNYGEIPWRLGLLEQSSGGERRSSP